MRDPWPPTPTGAASMRAAAREASMTEPQAGAMRAVLAAIESPATTYALRVATTSSAEARARLRDILTTALASEYLSDGAPKTQELR